MKIEPLQDFIKRTRKSKSTINRFYRKNPEYKEEVKRNRGKNYYPIEHARYFDSEIMFDENKLLQQENNSMRNVIDCLMDRDSTQVRLWYMDWTFFYTVAYRAERNKKSCFRMMNGLYESLINEYGDRTDLRLFFTTEPFANRKGYHNHFVIYVSNKSLQEAITDHISLYFENDRVDASLYDRYRAALFYMVKEGLVSEDWDILGNNLKAEGDKIGPTSLNAGLGI
jgi:hypothetical protein